jgi:hypothetical protein
MKTIVQYNNGKKYTINNSYISSFEWNGSDVDIDGEITTSHGIWEWWKTTLVDVKYIEHIDKENGVVYTYFNPNIKTIVDVKVISVNQKVKQNRKHQ